MKVLLGKINVKAIEKERLFVGKKGTYLDLVLIPTPDNKYNDYMIVQQTGKDEDSIILGNASEVKPKEAKDSNDKPNDPGPPDDLPF